MAHSRCSSCEMGGVQVINLKKTNLFLWSVCQHEAGKDGNNCRGIKIWLFGRTISALWGQVTGHNRSVTSPINTYCTNCLQPSDSSSFNYILTFFSFMIFCFLPVYPWFYCLSSHNSFIFAKSVDIKKSKKFQHNNTNKILKESIPRVPDIYVESLLPCWFAFLFETVPSSLCIYGWSIGSFGVPSSLF